MIKIVPPDNGSTDFYFSMAYQEEFYKSEDLKAILEAIDKDIWDKDVPFTEEVDNLICELEEELPKSVFQFNKYENL